MAGDPEMNTRTLPPALSRIPGRCLSSFLHRKVASLAKPGHLRVRCGIQWRPDACAAGTGYRRGDYRCQLGGDASSAVPPPASPATSMPELEFSNPCAFVRVPQ